MTTEQATIAQRVKEWEIRIDFTDLEPSDQWYQKDAYNWKVTLKVRGSRKRLTTSFFKGYGHRNPEPEVEEVLNCLALDCASIRSPARF